MYKKIFQIEPSLHGKFVISSFDNGLWSDTNKCLMYESDGYYVGKCKIFGVFGIVLDGKLFDPIVCDTNFKFLRHIFSGLSFVLMMTLILLYLINLIPMLKTLAHRNDYFRLYLEQVSCAWVNIVFLQVPFDGVMFCYYVILAIFYIINIKFWEQKNLIVTGCKIIGALQYYLLIWYVSAFIIKI